MSLIVNRIFAEKIHREGDQGGLGLLPSGRAICASAAASGHGPTGQMQGGGPGQSALAGRALDAAAGAFGNRTYRVLLQP
jgi:hypothetical protein